MLGPRGLLPNPKLETVSDEIIGAVHEVTAGRVELKMDKTANMAVVVAKRSFAADKLAENIRTPIDAILKAKPTSASGNCIGGEKSNDPRPPDLGISKVLKGL
jgi:large subunit ribosomal protein L1